MMTAAERHRELVTDFAAERRGLCKAQVMRVRWLPATDQARQACNVFQMRFVAAPGWSNMQAVIDPILRARSGRPRTWRVWRLSDLWVATRWAGIGFRSGYRAIVQQGDARRKGQLHRLGIGSRQLVLYR